MLDTDRIRFVTAHYSTLQGLKAAAFGVLWLGFFAREVLEGGFRPLAFAPSRSLQDAADGALLLLVLLATAAYVAADRYYRRTYGLVQPTRRRAYVPAVVFFGAPGAALLALLLSWGPTVTIGANDPFPLVGFVLFGVLAAVPAAWALAGRSDRGRPSDVALDRRALLGAITMGAGLLAFAIDALDVLSVFLLGLVWACALAAEWAQAPAYRRHYGLAAVCTAAASTSPLFLHAFTAAAFFYLAAGLIQLGLGLADHAVLARTFAPAEGEADYA